jgi:hypothetical protein
MQHYLNHLIADMRQAAKNLPAKPYYDIPPEAEGIEYVIEWENAVAKPMQEWFGIAKEQFPPAEKLTEEQLSLMVDEMLRLWEAYHFYPNLPENLPAQIVYKVLVDVLDKDIAWVSEGEGFVELCEYDPQTCPFPKEFCWCKDFEDDDMDAVASLRSDNAAEIAALDKEIKAIEAKGPDEFLPEKSMQRYVEQLIGDIRASAAKFLQPILTPSTDEDRSAEDIRQLATNPFVTLQKLTGIKATQFPQHIVMDGLQTRKVLRAMLHLLDACRLKIDFPPDAPHETKYEALREAWDVDEVQYLPLSGMDFDLCTGNPMTCPYGEYCNCGQPLEFDRSDVPARLRNMLKEISENNDCGMICFFNPETGEMEEAMPEWLDDPESFEDTTGEKWEDTFKFETWKQVITIDPPESHESFEIMEDFAEHKATGRLQQQLFDALNRKKPFRNFKNLIDNSDSRQEWFDYKQLRLEERAWELLHKQLPKNDANQSPLQSFDDDPLPF